MNYATNGNKIFVGYQYRYREQPIKLKTVGIYRSHRIKLPDAIIAATALVYDLTLISRNISDFGNINGLKIVNPWEK